MNNESGTSHDHVKTRRERTVGGTRSTVRARRASPVIRRILAGSCQPPRQKQRWVCRSMSP